MCSLPHFLEVLAGCNPNIVRPVVIERDLFHPPAAFFSRPDDFAPIARSAGSDTSWTSSDRDGERPSNCKRAFGERENYGTPLKVSRLLDVTEHPPEDALLRLDVGRTDHLGPLLGFGLDQLAEIGG